MSCGKTCNCATYRDHLLGISFTAKTTPNRKHAQRTVRVDSMDAQWERDAPAYKAFKEQGLQPKDVDGCAELQQRAATREEIETGTVLTPNQRTQMRVAKDQIAEVTA